MDHAAGRTSVNCAANKISPPSASRGNSGSWTEFDKFAENDSLKGFGQPVCRLACRSEERIHRAWAGRPSMRRQSRLRLSLPIEAVVSPSKAAAAAMAAKEASGGDHREDGRRRTERTTKELQQEEEWEQSPFVRPRRSVRHVFITGSQRRKKTKPIQSTGERGLKRSET